jgi:hypothetical protein
MKPGPNGTCIRCDYMPAADSTRMCVICKAYLQGYRAALDATRQSIHKQFPNPTLGIQRVLRTLDDLA